MASVWPGPRDYGAYCAPVKYLPTRPQHEVIAGITKQRRDAGLPVDAESVRQAIKNSQRPEYPLPGLYYTPEEQAKSPGVDRELAAWAEALVIDAGGSIAGVAWCWLDGRRAVTVSVVEDVERYRELLVRRLGADCVVVRQARYGEHELDDLRERITGDITELARAGIELAFQSASETGLEVRFFAADRSCAEQLLTDRYGPGVVPRWLGPASMAAEPQPFGSWICDGTQLTVFYPLGHNGERPGACTAREFPDRVIVALTILAPQGFRTEMDGFTPSHATVTLAAPGKYRSVIDAAHDLARPEWTGPGTTTKRSTTNSD